MTLVRRTRIQLVAFAFLLLFGLATLGVISSQAIASNAGHQIAYDGGWGEYDPDGMNWAG